MTSAWQERVALALVVAAVVAVLAHFQGRRLAGAIARRLLARGHVKWAMRFRWLAGPRNCC